MDLQIAGRVALVCSSTSGLGLAAARSLAQEGCHVIITGRRAELAHRIASDLPHAVAIPVDFTQPASADALVDAALDLTGPIDILVLNGPGPDPSSAAALDPSALSSGISLLVDHDVQLVCRTLTGMRERRWGRVISVGSSGVVTPIAHLAASNAGRAALASYLKTLAGEVACEGVTVNTVLPGRIATDRVADLDRRQAERTGSTVDAIQAASEGGIPMRRYGRAEEFGAVVAFIAGVSASYVTGSTIRCDGGLIPTI